MGLLYIFPVDKEDSEHTKVVNDEIILSSYGLPPIFWAYLAASLLTLALLSLAIWNPLLKVLNGEDIINYYLGLSVLALIIALPLIAIGFFFYRKDIHKKGTLIVQRYYLFGLNFFKKSINLHDAHALHVEHDLPSPNLAKLANDPKMRGFQNKGHFYLKAKNHKGKNIIIDRHSRKKDLEQLKTLLDSY